MVKLSRIVKKIVSNNEQNESKKKETNIISESFASKGKSQPTIDFNNLPSFETIKFAKEIDKNVVTSTKNKKLIKVNKNKQYKTKPDRLKHEKYKSKLYDRNKLDDSTSLDTNKPIKSPVTNENENVNKDKLNNIKRKEKIKVIKTDQSLSRGKRKRELKKEAWRRKHEFKQEAKKIIEQFQKEDKHGKALGNLTGLKGQLELVEQKIRSRSEMLNNKLKMRSKVDAKSILKNRRMFNVATSNL